MSRRLKRLIASTLTLSLYKPSASLQRFLSLVFPLLKLKNLLYKTLDLLMDSLFPISPSYDHVDDDDYDLLSLRHRPRPRHNPSDFYSPEPLYLVPFRWWNEAAEAWHRGVGTSGVSGFMYEATSCLNRAESILENDDSEIVLDMKRRQTTDCRKESVSGAGDLALVAEWMFLRALKWHNDVKSDQSFLTGEDYMKNLFSLQIRLAFLCETSSLIVKIRQKENNTGAFNMACDIFLVESGSLNIWDFSGQTTQFFIDDRKLSDHSSLQDQSLLELQVFGLPFFMKRRGKYDTTAEQTKFGGSIFSDSLKMNGDSDDANFYNRVDSNPQLSGSYSRACVMGLTGLYNLGNTCFMNSALQCLVHTRMLVDYFLGDFRKDINFENPLGMNGKLALAFGDLLRRLWTPGTTSVAPTIFKSTLVGFAPQFSGYNQHDSQELLAFLLDGLHEDLNRVKQKPYIELKDAEGRPDEEIADEHWQNHLARNDSIIVDVCQGQYRSTLVCPLCKKLSITFDPFMYLSLPLPSNTTRTITLTVLSTDGTALPFPVTVSVPKYGRFKDLVQALGSSCSLGDDEMLLVAEIYSNRLLFVLDDPDGSIDLIRDVDQLFAYRLPRAADSTPLAIFMHENRKYSSLSSKLFGIPLVTRISSFSNGLEIYTQFLKVIKPFLLPVEAQLNDYDDSGADVGDETEMEDAISTTLLDEEMESEGCMRGNLSLDDDFEFYLMMGERRKIDMNEPVPVSGSPENVQVFVSWSEKMIELYDISLLSTLPEVCRPQFSKKPHESISLYKCLEAFLKEEPLGPEDMWYCPNCKMHRQAIKKLDLWRLPEILIVHLKRFSYSQILKNKLETFVNYPNKDFDLSSYIVHRSDHGSHRYILYAISNHYGGMGGGHYTAFVQHGINQWYEFDDSHVSPISEDQIKTSAAYVLFYRRGQDE